MIMQVETGCPKGYISVLRGEGIANGDEGFSCTCFPVELDWASGSHDELVRKQ